MDSPPMILPKGIVINTTNIYKEVAGYPVIPADKVWEYWHVYTTTNKKLKDPTARRLENFWWHVWGSDRRFLSGQALARLYEDISMGPTFVPLRGPPNRWEGDVPPLLLQAIEAASHANLRERGAEDDSSQPSDEAGPSTKASLKSLSSSASKPPPAHPILKKARGPSSSGPRPTARFLHPDETADDDKDSDIPSSGSTATMGTEPRVSSASPVKKKQGTPTKTFMASGSAKRRSVLPRRLSSQSPSNSESGLQGGSSAGSRNSPAQRAVSPIPEATSNHVTPDSGEAKVSMPPQQPPWLSAKAAGKRPAMPRRSTAEEKQAQNPSSRPPEPPASQGRENKPPEPTLSGPRTTQPQPLVDLPLHSRRASESPRLTGGDGGIWSAGQEVEAPASMARSNSHTGYDRYKSRQPPTQGLFTGATASTTNVAAQGTIIEQSGVGSMPLPSMYDRREDDYTLPSRPTASSLLESRLTPTQPSTSASVPLGRTRSQLTLLLEREKARTGDKQPPKS